MSGEKKHAAHPGRRTPSEERLDEAVEGSFPASDPLPSTSTSVGAPKRQEGAAQPKAKRKRASKS
jgi:hypothetical protein